MNLLKETLEDIKSSGHIIDDIVFIGSEASGFCCEWNEYESIANIEYDNGFGAQEIAADLIVVFSDGSKMWRHEYDGSECWSYSMPFKIPETKKKITTVCSGGVWSDLEDMNKVA